MESSVVFFKNSRDSHGKLRQIKLPFSCSLHTWQYSPWGLFPQKNSIGRCSPHRSSSCCDTQSSKHQAGQVAALNRAHPSTPTSSPTSAQVPLASGAVRGGGVYLRLRRRRNKCYLQKEKSGRFSLLFKTEGLSVTREGTSLRVVRGRKHPPMELLRIRAWSWNHGSFCLFSYLPQRNG